MDPNAAAAIMRDETLPNDERLEAAKNLRQWLLGGGFPQTMYMSDGKHRAFGGNTEAKRCALDEANRYIDQLLKDSVLANIKDFGVDDFAGRHAAEEAQP